MKDHGFEIVDCNTSFGSDPKKTNDAPLGDLLGDLAAHNIGRAFAFSWKAVHYDPVEGNDEAIETAAEHDALIPAAVLDPRNPSLGDEAARCHEKGVRLFRIFPELHGYDWDYLPLERMIERFAPLDVPLMVSAMPGGTLPALARLSARFSFPVIMTAVSYGSAAETLAAGKLAPNLFIESHILSSPGLIELFVAELGADRLVYGSNAPVHYVGNSLAALIHAKISHDDKQAIVRDNILRLTGVRND